MRRYKTSAGVRLGSRVRRAMRQMSKKYRAGGQRGRKGSEESRQEADLHRESLLNSEPCCQRPLLPLAFILDVAVRGALADGRRRAPKEDMSPCTGEVDAEGPLDAVADVGESVDGEKRAGLLVVKE
jgi:hypothetical protein